MNDGFYAMRDVTRLTTLSDTSVWRLVEAGEFPRPMRISERRNVWPVEQVSEWIAARKKAAAEQIVNKGGVAA